MQKHDNTMTISRPLSDSAKDCNAAGVTQYATHSHTVLREQTMVANNSFDSKYVTTQGKLNYLTRFENKASTLN